MKEMSCFDADYLYTVLSTDVCILFSCFCYSLISVSQKQVIERVLALPYSYKGQKFIK